MQEPEKTPIPTLGDSADEVYRALEPLSRHSTSQHIVRATVPLLGIFRWDHGRLMRVVSESDGRGTGSWVRPVTDEESDEFHAALERDQVQIDVFTAIGAIGYGDGGRRVKELHRARGRSFGNANIEEVR